MFIRTTGKDIEVKVIIGEEMKRDGKSYPALRLEFEEEISAEAIDALMSGSLEIMEIDENGEEVLLGVHEGYNTKGSLSLTLGKITSTDIEIKELKAKNAELQEAINVMVGGNAE